MEHAVNKLLKKTQRCITVDRTPLDEWSARRRNLTVQPPMPLGGIRNQNLNKLEAAELSFDSEQWE